MSQENVERLRAVYAEWAKGNFRAGGELFAPDASYHSGAPGQSPAYGTEAIEARMREFLGQWGEFWVEAEEFTDYGEMVLVSERQHGIGKGSGVETDQAFYAVWTFREGLVVGVRWDTDRTSALEAAGLE